MFPEANPDWQLPTALRPVRTSDPASGILTADEVRAHLRLEDVDTTDEYLNALIAAVESYLDGYSGVLGRALINQSWSQAFDTFPWSRIIRLPIGILQSIDSVTYFAPDGTQQTFDEGSYSAVEDAIGPCVVLAWGQVWPITEIRPDAVTVTWTCGYGADASAVPAPIIHAAKLLIGHFYANREAVFADARAVALEVPMAVDMLLTPFRAPALA